MKETFSINPSIKIIFIFVFVFGLILSVFHTDLILLLNNQSGPTIKERKEEVRLSKSQLSKLEKEKILILVDEDSEASPKIAHNIEMTLTYMKKEPLLTSYRNIPIDLSKYDSIVLTFEELDKLSTIDRLMEYVEDGGSIFFAIRPEIGDDLYQIYRKLGINEIGDYITTQGVKVNSSILFGAKGKKFKDSFFVNSSLSLTLDSNVKALLESPEGVPLLWRSDYGKGRFIVFNGTVLESKDNRGIISGAVSLTKDDYVYPVMNAKVAFIDDFPAPFQETDDPFIKKEYHLNTDTFFQNIWWPEIQKGAAKYDILYTGVMIETYNGQIHPPFDSEGLQARNKLTRYGRDLLKMGGELGYHGYNHQSLTLDQEDVKELGYQAWDSIEDMEESLKELASFSQHIFPKYHQRTYVPPSNIISKAGLKAIKNALPNVEVISSLYFDNPNNHTYSQEYMVDDEFIHFPRITSGYINEEENYWATINSINSLGIFSHFIHPDDILDPERRNGKKWEDLSESYNRYLKYVHRNYSWLKPMIVAQAADEVSAYWKVQSYVEHSGNEITIYNDHVSNELTFILRSKDRIASVEHGEYREIDEDVYEISTSSSKALIKLERRK